MIVKFIGAGAVEVSEPERKYVVPAQQAFTGCQSYEVHAVSVYDGVTFILVIDDLNAPVFAPRCLFETIDKTIETDWIITVFQSGPVQFLLGPHFIARDLDSYSATVDQRLQQMTLLRERIRLRHSNSGEGTT